MTKTSKIALWVVVAILVLGAAYFVFFYESPVAGPADEVSTEPVTFCTLDAKQCPDGSYVGRTGPNCEFVCPDGESSSNAGVPIVDGNVEADGTVTTFPADVGK